MVAMIREKEIAAMSGIPMLLLTLAGLVAGTLLSIRGAPLIGAPLLVVFSLALCGFFMVSPNQAKVLQLFGDYVGTVRSPGLRWANPFYSKKAVSTRIRNFDCERLKVNDLHGSPIEIAAVVVWQVRDTAAAVFEVDDYEHFVRIQTESALRGLATRYAYDLDENDAGVALRSHADEVAIQLVQDIEARVGDAGVHILEARISHLAYAPEIASAMLQRQQAAAILAARKRIVDGAVGMVEMALARLAENQVVTLDEERKAAMVSNLLVVLCSERSVAPVVNTGTLYS